MNGEGKRWEVRTQDINHGRAGHWATGMGDTLGLQEVGPRSTWAKQEGGVAANTLANTPILLVVTG